MSQELLPIVTDSTPTSLQGDPLSQVWWQGRQWAVTSFGIECRDGTYVIESGRLREDLPRHSWIRQIGEKEWADLDDFATAFFVACTLHSCFLTEAEISLLKKHFSEEKSEHNLRPYKDRARSELGFDGTLMLTLDEMDSIDRRAAFLARQDGN